MHQHLLFWLAVLFILLNVFKTSSSFEKIDLVYTLIFLVPVTGMVYLNLYLALPRFLGKEKYLLYALCFLVLLAAGAFFIFFLFDRWIDLLLPGYYFISYYSVGELMLFTGSFLVLTTLLKLSRSWFMLLRIEKVTTSEQLHSLHSQINPHFLLNGLQTIYGLSLERSDKAPKVILQLAGILKYTLYETRNPRVSLVEELEMITDYVEIFRARTDPDRVAI
jgi:sensor histidine kinase YesM